MSAALPAAAIPTVEHLLEAYASAFASDLSKLDNALPRQIPGLSRSLAETAQHLAALRGGHQASILALRVEVARIVEDFRDHGFIVPILLHLPSSWRDAARLADPALARRLDQLMTHPPGMLSHPRPLIHIP